MLGDTVRQKTVQHTLKHLQNLSFWRYQFPWFWKGFGDIYMTFTSISKISYPFVHHNSSLTCVSVAPVYLNVAGMHMAHTPWLHLYYDLFRAPIWAWVNHLRLLCSRGVASPGRGVPNPVRTSSKALHGKHAPWLEAICSSNGIMMRFRA